MKLPLYLIAALLFAIVVMMAWPNDADSDAQSPASTNSAPSSDSKPYNPPSFDVKPHTPPSFDMNGTDTYSPGDYFKDATEGQRKQREIEREICRAVQQAKGEPTWHC